VLTLRQTGDYHFNQTPVKVFKIKVFKGQGSLQTLKTMKNRLFSAILLLTSMSAFAFVASNPSTSVPPTVGNPGCDKPHVKKPEVKKPEAKKPEVKKPEAKKPEAKKPEVKKPEAKHRR
jgi:hypothetical protein